MKASFLSVATLEIAPDDAAPLVNGLQEFLRTLVGPEQYDSFLPPEAERLDGRGVRQPEFYLLDGEDFVDEAAVAGRIRASLDDTVVWPNNGTPAA